MGSSALLDKEIKKFLMRALSNTDTKRLKADIEYIEVSPSKLKNGSKKIIKYKNGTTRSKTLSAEEASLAAQAMCQYFEYEVNAVKYSKGTANKIFEIKDNKIIMLVAKAYVPLSKNSCILIASNHKNIRTSLSNFSESFTRFIKSKRELFLDYEGMQHNVKRSDFAGPRGISNKYVKHLGTIDGISQIKTGNQGMQTGTIDVSSNIVASSVSSNPILKEYVKKELEDTKVKYKSKGNLTPFSKILGTLHIKMSVPSWLYDEKHIKKAAKETEFTGIKRPVMSNLVNSIFSIFHIDKKKKNHFAKKVKKSKVSSSGTIKPKVKIPEISKVNTYKPSVNITVNDSGRLPDCGIDLKRLLQLKGLFNLNLHDQLSKQMPHGLTIWEATGVSTTEDEPLNYKTGRFARSAQVTNLTIDRNTCELRADFTYDKDPYEAFEPGGEFYKYSRNPDLIIRTAILDIARDIMKDRFAIHPRLV